MSRPPVRRARRPLPRQPQRLGAVRDAGINVGTRRTARQPKSPYPVMTIVVAIIGLAVIGWMLSWKTAPSSETKLAGTALSAEAVTMDERDPTPLFAELGSTRLNLPIDPTQLTALGYHQASGANAMHLTSLVPDANMDAANQLKAVPPYQAPADWPNDVWTGTCLRFWRSGRGGMPDTAADVGADPGTAVWSPVTGTVVNVRQYLLYDKYEDYEVHIRPDGRDDVDVVLIHMTDVRVKTGDKVRGGVTRLASVRKMSDKIEIQLGGYTANGGDHVHVQVNSLVGPTDPASGGGS